MPIKVPNDLPAIDTLNEENIFVMTDSRAMTQDIRPLKILLLNLMPTKIVTETQLTRALSNSPLQVELELLQTTTHVSHNTPQEHMLAFYKTFDEVRGNNYDGFIITGTPVEYMEYEEVDFWDEVCEILDWARIHCHSCLYLCWGAQAALYHYYGIPKIILKEKIAGVYKHHLDQKNGMLFRGFDDEFYVPHSRGTDIRREDIEAVPTLKILASSDEVGVYAAKSDNDKEIYIMGHAEYDADTLKKEYIRDTSNGKKMKVPDHYFPDDDPTKDPIVRWRSCANLLYSNWLNYFVYQSTPYDIRLISGEDLEPVKPTKTELTVAKFGGCTLTDAADFRRVKEIIEKDPARKYIVVSAPGKKGGEPHVTDLLVGGTGSPKKLGETLDHVGRRLGAIADELGVGADIPQEIEHIRQDVRKGVYGGNYVVSRGEYLTAKLLAAYLGIDFVDATDLIVFRYEGGVDLEKSRRKVQETLASHERAVIPGFYGAFENGVITVFPRGGSDITGAIIADAVGADLYENWTDVPGMLMADPHVVEGALAVPIVTYSEIREMARLGAEVLHQDTVLPVKRLGIPINIRSAFEPDEPGTLIAPKADQYRTILEISGISGKSGYACISIERDQLNETDGMQRAIQNVIRAHGITLRAEMTGADTYDVLVMSRELREKGAGLKEELEEVTEGTVGIGDDLALIGVVGRNIASSPGVAVKVFDALSREQIDVKFIDSAPGRISLTFGVEGRDLAHAIRAIYKEFTHLVRKGKEETE